MLEYRIPSLEANKLMEQSQQCLHDISQSLAEGENDDKLWQLLQVNILFCKVRIGVSIVCYESIYTAHCYGY